MIDISHALTVPGWLTEEEARHLAETASHCFKAAEIGSWKGRSTCALASGIHGYIYAIDTWRGSPEHKAELRDKDEDWLFEEFISNTQPFANKILHCRMKSTTAARMIARNLHPIDMVFIDAEHSYESTKADILAWTPLLREGGILCGHDFDPQGRYWPGVKKAVEECVPKFRVVPGTSIWTTEGV